MWIIYILLYLLGIVIATFIFGYFNFDLYYTPGTIIGILVWPVLLFVLVFIFIPVIIPYEIGLWANKYKNQIDLKSYLKETFLTK